MFMEGLAFFDDSIESFVIVVYSWVFVVFRQVQLYSSAQFVMR